MCRLASRISGLETGGVSEVSKIESVTLTHAHRTYAHFCRRGEAGEDTCYLQGYMKTWQESIDKIVGDWQEQERVARWKVLRVG